MHTNDLLIGAKRADVTTLIENADQELSRISAKIAVLEKARDIIIVGKLHAAREYPIPCPFCKKSHELHSWTFVQTMWCVFPVGSIDGSHGDTWTSHTTDLCALVCPERNGMLRIRDYPNKDIANLLSVLWGFPPKEVFDRVKKAT